MDVAGLDSAGFDVAQPAELVVGHLRKGESQNPVVVS